MSDYAECIECGDNQYVIEYDRVECAKNGHKLNHPTWEEISKLQAELADFRAALREAAIEKARGCRDNAPCGHNAYWTGQFGTCMVCRADKAKAEAETEIADMIERRSTEGYFLNEYAKQAIIGWIRDFAEEDRRQERPA